MKKKKINLELVIIGAVIVLSLIYIMFRKSDKVHYRVPELDHLKSGKIMKILITKGDRIVSLENKKGGWVVGEEAYPAQAPLVENILKRVADIKLTTLVSRAANYYKYELDDERKINVKVYSDEEILREFDLGKTAATYDHTHIRLKDDKNVYHAEGSIRNDLDKTLDDLRNKDVFSFDKGNVTEVAVTLDGKTYTLNKRVLPVTAEKKSDGEEAPKTPRVQWKFNGKDVEESKVSPALNTLSDLKCDRYVYNDIELKGTELFFTIRFKGVEESTITFLKSGDEKSDKYIGKTPQSKYTFYVRKYQVDNIVNPLKDLFRIKSTPLPPLP